MYAALHTRISKWIHITTKSTSDKFPMTGSHGRWPSIRNRIVIPDVPYISEPMTETSRTYQPEGIILCGITAFIPTASPNAFAELTGPVCLAINKCRGKEKLKGDDKLHAHSQG